MSIEFFQKIAFRLTRITVIIAFILGILISLGQVLLDFKKQQTMLDQAADEIFHVSKDTAYRIAYQLDENYAHELLDGLKKYQILQAAKLLDDRQNPLAQFQNSLANSGWADVTSRIIGATNSYSYALRGEDGYTVGYLELVTNNHQALMPFYNRALYIFWGGFLRNMTLAAMLLVVFYYFVTKPLTSLAMRLSQIDAKRPRGARLDKIESHRNSEIGYIVGAVNYFIASAEEYQQDLSNLEKQLRTIMDTVPLQIFAVDVNHKLLFSNNHAAEFYGIEGKKLIGKDVVKLHNQKSAIEGAFIADEIQAVIAKHQESHVSEKLLTNASNLPRSYEVTFIPLPYFNQKSVLVVLNDVSEKVASQQVIKHLAYQDALTGLANRSKFHDQLKKDILRAEESGHYGALLLIDLDKFKLINDTLGHAMGDKMLVDVANKLTEAMGDAGMLARMGGDEFAICLNTLSDSPQEATIIAMQKGREINELLNNEIVLAGHGYQIGASIGVVCYPQTSGDVTNLLRFADAALYQAKNDGRNQVKLFEQKIIDKLTHQVEIEKDIRKAIQNHEFIIALQPIYRNECQSPVAAEALIRWQHPEKGLLGPHMFMDCIESLNLAHHISGSVIRQCGEVANQIGVDYLLARNFRFNINISTLEFYEPDFTHRIKQQIEDTGIPFKLFEMEITESIALHDLRLANQKLHGLTQLGINIALDDFGTGYSSLSYLKSLDVHKVKIDKSFIDGIESDHQDQKLVDSIITIARNFDLDVVVEGVEGPEQYQWLTQYSDLLYQGYYLNRPLFVEDFEEIMAKEEEQKQAI